MSAVILYNKAYNCHLEVFDHRYSMLLLFLLAVTANVTFCYKLDQLLPMIDKIAYEKYNGSIKKCIHFYLDNVAFSNISSESQFYCENDNRENSVYQYWARDSPYVFAKYQVRMPFYSDVRGYVNLLYPSQDFHSWLLRSTKSTFCVVLIIPRYINLIILTFAQCY